VRSDVVRAGVGRLAFELALGACMALAGSEAERVGVALAALAAALAASRMPERLGRRLFVAAHASLVASAVAAWLARAGIAALPIAAIGLGGGLELLHRELTKRRHVPESWRTLRLPESALLRRIGSVVLVGVGARLALALAPFAAHAEALPRVLVVLGALACLGAGMGAGPGRPVTRPIDAALFVLAGAAVALAGG
jgi:hypothetical protein